MSIMNEFFKDCLELPFATNSQDNPNHENQVEDLLKKHGLDYTAQPNGIQKSPDFMVHYNGNDYPIECKSSKQAYPTYNGGLPKHGAIYIFSSKKYNATTVYRAEDVVIDDTREWLEGTIDALQETLDQRRKIKPEDSRGLDFYIRNMFIQMGGADKTNYFLHEDRARCESNVINGVY